MWCDSNKKVIHNMYLLLETFGRSIISEKSGNKNATFYTKSIIDKDDWKVI